MRPVTNAVVVLTLGACVSAAAQSYTTASTLKRGRISTGVGAVPLWYYISWSSARGAKTTFTDITPELHLGAGVGDDTEIAVSYSPRDWATVSVKGNIGRMGWADYALLGEVAVQPAVPGSVYSTRVGAALKLLMSDEEPGRFPFLVCLGFGYNLATGPIADDSTTSGALAFQTAIGVPLRIGPLRLMPEFVSGSSSKPKTLGHNAFGDPVLEDGYLALALSVALMPEWRLWRAQGR